MRFNLDALNHGGSGREHGYTMGKQSGGAAPALHDQMAALMELGMIAAPSPYRQSKRGLTLNFLAASIGRFRYIASRAER